MKTVLLGLVAVTSLIAQLSAPRPPDTCKVHGQIVQQAGAPIRKADIRLFSVGQHGESEDVEYSAVTDAQGKFDFGDVKPGAYRVAYDHPGFVDAEKRHHGDGMLLFIEPGQESKELLFHMAPAAVISGKVLDSDGDPVPKVEVGAVPYPHNPHAMGGSSGGYTNELGEFRIGDLAPKQYLLVVQPWRQLATAVQSAKKAPDEMPAYATTYYPSTTDLSQAIPLKVGPGDQINADIQLAMAHPYRVRGEVTNLPEGAGDLGIVLRPLGDMSMGIIDPWPVDKNGNFEIREVLPGSYAPLITFTDEKTSRTERGDPTIQVSSSDIDGLRISAVPNGEIRGQLRTDDGKRIDWSQLRVTLSSRTSSRRGIRGSSTSFGNGLDSIYWDDQVPYTEVKQNGSFEMKDVPADNYHVQLVATNDNLADYYLKSVNLSGRDITDSGFTTTSSPQSLEVVISTKGASLEGIVTDDSKQPARYVKVICIPETKQRGRQDLFGGATTDQLGHFTLRGLTPGEYQVLSTDEDIPDDISDPAFVTAHESLGLAIKLAEGEHKSVSLKLVTPED